MMNYVKSKTRKALTRHPRMSQTLVELLDRMHGRTLARRIASSTGHFPEVLSVDIHGNEANVTLNFVLRMASCRGMEPVARRAWEMGWKEFENPMPRIFSCFVNACDGAIGDVGANSGYYSLMAARISPDRPIHAFEPFVPVLKILRNNISLNKGMGNIRVFDYALAEKEGHAELYIPDQSHGMVESSCSLSAEFKETHQGRTSVKVVTLDKHAAEEGVRFGLLKIDVEGAEPLVLAGAHRVFASDRPIVFIELVDKRNEAFMQEFCKEYSYVSFLLSDGGAIRESPISHSVKDWNHVIVPVEREKFATQLFQSLSS